MNIQNCVKHVGIAFLSMNLNKTAFASWAKYGLLAGGLLLTNGGEAVPFATSTLTRNAYTAFITVLAAAMTFAIIDPFNLAKRIDEIPKKWGPKWAAWSVTLCLQFATVVLIIPNFVWGDAYLIPTAVAGTATRLPAILLSLVTSVGSISIFLGGLGLGIGARAYFSINKSRKDALYMDVLDAIEYLGVSTDIENINKLTDLLIDRERYGTVTIEEWSDVTEDHPDWEWNIRPKDIRQVIQHPNFERKGRQLPLTTEAHRRWRIAGVGLILIGSLIDVFLAGSSMDSVAMFVFLTLLLGWMTSSMLMEGGFFPVTGSV